MFQLSHGHFPTKAEVLVLGFPDTPFGNGHIRAVLTGETRVLKAGDWYVFDSKVSDCKAFKTTVGHGAHGTPREIARLVRVRIETSIVVSIAQDPGNVSPKPETQEA